MKQGVHLLAAALVALSFAPSGAAVAADAAPDSATIRDRIATAAGPAPNAYHERFDSTSSDGTTSTEDVWRRGRDWRRVNQNGPFRTQAGANKGEAWHQNENGQTVIDQTDPGSAVRETTTTTVTRIHDPIDGYAVAALTANGRGVKDYVDLQWHVVRRDAIVANGTIVTTFDDFRAAGSYTFAHHWHAVNPIAGTTTDGRVTAFDAGDVTDADLTVPPSRRTLVEFPASARSVVLPTTFAFPHVVVRVGVGPRNDDLVLDSGASGIVIDPTVAHDLGLRLYGVQKAVTAGQYDTAKAIVPEMRIGPLVMHDVVVRVAPLGWERNGGVKEMGLLGFDFLAELGVSIDYEKQQVTVVPQPAFTPPSDPHAVTLPIRIRAQVPMTDVSINGALGERWVLDTGASGTFMIFDYFARRYPNALRDVGTDSRAYNVRHYGVGGSFETRPYTLETLKLGNVVFQGFTGYRVLSQTSFSEPADGLIGPMFFRLFTLQLDYGDSRVYLVPNAAGRKAMGIR